MNIVLSNEAGNFGENKDVARRIRIKQIMPALVDNEEVILDFKETNKQKSQSIIPNTLL